MKPEFWWIYIQIIFSLTMQTASDIIILQNFFVNVDYTSNWFFLESNPKHKFIKNTV
jgi:hypothetical protein